MIYLGTVNWRYSHWVESFYPNDDESQWLSYYSKQASFAEIRSTYTSFLSSEIIKQWDSNTPEDFIFSASMNKQITYNTDNEVKKQSIKKFFEALEPLSGKLGVVILHFPKQMQLTDANFSFVSNVIDGCHEFYNGDIVVDLNNRSWYTEKVNQMLSEKKSCILNSDRRPIGSSMSNPDFYYLKLSGDSRLIPKKEFGKIYFPRDGDIKQWANHLKFKSKRHKRIYVAIDNHFSGDSTKDAYMISNALKDMKIKSNGFKR